MINSLGFPELSRNNGLSNWCCVERLFELAESKEGIAFLTKDIHVWTYFHRNQSLRANAHLTDIITELKMSKTFDASILTAIRKGSCNIARPLIIEDEEANVEMFTLHSVFLSDFGYRSLELFG
jgi:ribulose kinase